MASQAFEPAVVLLAIHPEYAEAILQGRKKVEFRKRSFRRRISHVVVYSTKPVARITGVFAVRAIDEGPPQKLWAKYRQVGGISESRFFDYYSGALHGVAIRVAQAWRLSSPMKLNEVGHDLSAPQSFAYLSDYQIESILGSSESTVS